MAVKGRLLVSFVGRMRTVSIDVSEDMCNVVIISAHGSCGLKCDSV